MNMILNTKNTLENKNEIINEQSLTGKLQKIIQIILILR
jgi:hypothetical protein